MSFTTVSSALLVAGITASAAPSRKQVSALDDSFAVPGDNPLLFCEDPAESKYILDLDSVDISPILHLRKLVSLISSGLY